jgi:hypothetical protein
MPELPHTPDLLAIDAHVRYGGRTWRIALVRRTWSRTTSWKEVGLVDLTDPGDDPHVWARAALVTPVAEDTHA